MVAAVFLYTLILGSPYLPKLVSAPVCAPQALFFLTASIYIQSYSYIIISFGWLHQLVDYLPLPLICAAWKAAASCCILSPSIMATLLLPAHSLAASPRWPILATRQAALHLTNITERIRRYWPRMWPVSRGIPVREYKLYTIPLLTGWWSDLCACPRKTFGLNQIQRIVSHNLEHNTCFGSSKLNRGRMTRWDRTGGALCSSGKFNPKRRPQQFLFFKSYYIIWPINQPTRILLIFWIKAYVIKIRLNYLWQFLCIFCCLWLICVLWCDKVQSYGIFWEFSAY